MSDATSTPTTAVRENALQPKSGWVILPFHFMMLGINIALIVSGAHGDGDNPAPIPIIEPWLDDPMPAYDCGI